MDDFKQKCFFKAFVRIPILSHWCPPSVIKTVSVLDKDNIDSVSISCGSPKIIYTVNIDDNTQVLLKEGLDYHSAHLSPQLNQGMYLEILKVNDTSISDFYSNIYLYEQFLSLAALRMVKCSEISLYDKTVYQEFKNGEKHYFPIQLIYVQRTFNDPHKFQSSDFLFTYTSIKTQYPEIICRWYSEKKEIAPIREHMIDSIENKRVYTSVDFLIMIQALEGFWWRFRDEDYRVKNKIPVKKKTELKTVIGELLKEFDNISIIKTLDLDIEAVVDSRHYYSHFMNKSKKPKTLDGLELLHVTFKLRKLLICCVLNFIGFGNTEINQILNDRYNSFINR